jgi:hypothetical protein
MGKLPLAWVVSLAVLSAGSLFCANVAMAETQTAKSGNVQAEFSSQEGEPCFTKPSLQIIRQSQTILDQPLSTEDDSCRANLQVRDLDADREPEVILDLFTGGAHCCTFSLIYRYDPALKQYTSIEHFWGNAGYGFKDLNRDGIPEFNSWDDAFAYAFASYAGSAYPPQIWQYRAGRMSDVTKSYPQLVYSHAYQLWQDYTKGTGGEPKAMLAAYLASKYILGQSEDSWRTVQQAYQESDRTSFFKELRIFLQQTGYIRNPGQTEFYRLAQLEKTGIYNKCPQGTRLNKAGETANYRFGLCSGNEADYYLGVPKRGGESITIQRQSNDPINSFRKGEYVYRLSDEKGSANMYLEVFQGNRQLRREMIQKVYRW